MNKIIALVAVAMLMTACPGGTSEVVVPVPTPVPVDACTKEGSTIECGGEWIGNCKYFKDVASLVKIAADQKFSNCIAVDTVAVATGFGPCVMCNTIK